MIWAYLMHLGRLMWGDFGPGDGGKCIITDEWTFDDKVWHSISQRLHDQGRCNMIVMDIGEGVEYESHPEIKAPGSWSKKQLAAEISRLRALGFEVTYQPKIDGKATEIEIHVRYKDISGIIDTKYYQSGFTLTQNLANYMASEYIPNYLNYNNQTLTFYGYITSSKYTGEKKLQSITPLAEKIAGKQVEGFLMQRDVLIGFLDYCLENDLPVEKRIELFVNNINNKGITIFR